MPKFGNFRTNFNFGSQPFACFCFISGSGLPKSANLSGKYKKCSLNSSLCPHLDQSVQPKLTFPDAGPMNQILAINTKILENHEKHYIIKSGLLHYFKHGSIITHVFSIFVLKLF